MSGVGELSVGFLGAFCGGAFVLLAMTWLPRVALALQQREERRPIMPPETFRAQWGRNWVVFLWRRFVRGRG